MKIIGLTGGSGTGKSTVAQLFAARGVPSVDADAVYRGLCERERGMLREIDAAFGGVLTPQGALDRKKLAAIVFGSADELRRLGEITTPYIRAASAAALARFAAEPIVLYDAPTLFETGADALCTGGVIGVLAPEQMRVRRVRARDGLDEQAARARIAAQPPDEFYREKCRFLIENSGDLPQLRRAVDAIYEELKKER